jgi:hypothetical protein
VRDGEGEKVKAGRKWIVHTQRSTKQTDNTKGSRIRKSESKAAAKKV